MKRLTSYKNDCKREMICQYEDCDVDEEHCPHINEDNCACLQDILQRMAEYDDLEKQGKLIMLPCVVGDKIYVKMQSGEYAEGEVRDFTHFLTCGFCIVVTSTKCEFDKKNIPLSEFGKTVFLTKEDAQKALENIRAGSSACRKE